MGAVPPMLSAKTWCRSVAVVLCAILALTGLGAAAHEANVEHHRCAEHGERVHVADGGAADDEAPSEDGEHEHCPLVSASTAAPFTVADAAAGIVDPAVACTCIAGPRAEARGLRSGAQLVVAPKTSPPVPA